MSKQVMCINKRPAHYDPHERIQAIGGVETSAAIAQGGGYAVSLSPISAISVNRWRGRRPWAQTQ